MGHACLTAGNFGAAMWPLLAAILLLRAPPSVTTEYLQEFDVTENVPLMTTVGFIGQSASATPPPPPPYLIVPVPNSAVDTDLSIDQATGEIRTNVVLDRELRSQYSFVAIPLSGENVRIVIRVRDANDNSPEFPSPFMAIEFPENTPRDVKRTLSPARDRDLGEFNTQRYEIVSGNVNNAFRLASHRERDDVLYLDLQVNGFLDREATPSYSLIIEAYDGGRPPLKGSMTVNITIQDVNDNQPIFNQSRYFATVAENATVGTSVLRVFATDADAGENGQVHYSINRRQSDRENMFSIDPNTGVISVNKPLDFESKDVHELVVVARDHGAQPLETTAFVSIRVTDVNDNQPTINLIFLSDDASPKISEDARPGEFVARISVNDPDSKEEYANVNVTLRGGDGHFGLTTQDNIIYLVIVSHPLDRETRANYSMVVTATDKGSPPLNASRAFDLAVTDANDNAPQFDRDVYYANVLEVADPGTSVLQLSATDRDEGRNSAVRYTMMETPETYSQWFRIDAVTGLLTTRTHIDCETNPVPRVTVVATDGGEPPLSSSATVVVTISDVNDNEPIFDQSFYNITVSEDESVGKCLLKVSATDPDCGVNAMVNFTLASDLSRPFMGPFDVNPSTGQLCLSAPLDYERRRSYEIPISATDRGGLSTVAMVKVHVLDVNDNRPVFYPREYNVSLREHDVVSTPVVVVVASDPDSGVFGQVRYSIVNGNKRSLFRVDGNTGEIFVVGRPPKDMALHHLVITAEDGGGLQSELDAHVYISILNRRQQPPIFEQARYRFQVREDVNPRTVIGTVVAKRTDRGAHGPRYSIYSGDPEGYFSIDPLMGSITVQRSLDHEEHPFILLNVQATSGNPPSYGHTQVNVTVWDVNDNAPAFESHMLKISIPENTDIESPIYVAHARDPDSGRNGAVRYSLQQNPEGIFRIGPKSGTIVLRRALDYETHQRYELMLVASDSGSPPLSSNMTLAVEVQDVNDNLPVFERPVYRVNVLESLPANSQFLQVTATDKDTGNNARLTFRLSDASQQSGKFSIFPNSGFLYIKEMLDREAVDHYALTVEAVDNGAPPLTATATVHVQVLDVNDNDPKFDLTVFEFEVRENVEKGHHVGTVSAHDKDLGNNAALRYTLVSANESFQVNPITGEISTKALLDRETKATHELVADVHDKGSPPRFHRATVRISVIDINDNSPVFVEPVDTVVGVREEQPVGTELAQVQATDADEGRNADIIYEIVQGGGRSDGSAAFAVHRTSGVVTTRMVLDHEERDRYTLVIVARDNGSPPRESRLTLQVQVFDLNDHQPTFFTSSLNFHIMEGLPVGREVGVIHAVDQDAGDNGHVTYMIAGGNLYNVFDIGKTTGVLYTIREVDYEVASEYTLQVTAVDSSATNPRSNVINVRVKVDDVNDCIPTFKDDPIMFSVPENVRQGTPVWNFSASDLDSGVNGKVRYSIAEQSPMPAFQINPATGVLTLVSSLDYETNSEFTVIVKATDQAKDPDKRLFSTATCKIIVEDENDNTPMFKSKGQVDVMEDEPIGYTVLHIIAVDKDSRDNGRVTYIINSGNEKGHFSLDYDSGLLSIVKPLDREETSHFVLNISVSDHGRIPRSAFQVLHIYVQDVNDSPPHFLHEKYYANISEASPVGTSVVTVQAADRDLGSTSNLTYTIPSGVAGNKFTVHPQTGVIKTTAKLDRETMPSYYVTVYVADGSFHYDTALVTIDVSDINDHPPKFGDSCYPLYVPENSDLRVIHTLVASDEDTGRNADIMYSITDGNLGNKFSIDLRSGRLSSRPLDREQQSQYHLVVIARDQGDPPRTGTCNITVHVLDENDNDPHFEHSEYSATLPEDAPLNSTVLVIKAMDRDEGLNGRVTYSLGNETASLFNIDSDSGVITTAGLFNREKKSRYMFEVRASDSGKYDARWERAVVHVTVVDINDNRPVFTKYPFVASVSAHAHSGTQVSYVQAIDADDGPNAEVFYSFPNPVMSHKFHLDPDTGLVTIAGSLLSDNGNVIHVDIVAHDRGRPPKMSTGVLEVHVGPGTASVPSLQFQNNTYHAQISEVSPRGTEVLRVRAYPPEGTSAQITYGFNSENDGGPLTIHPTNGVIRVRDPKQLDYEGGSSITLVVIARTEGLITMYGYATVVVDLIDENDNAPRFSQERYVASVWEGNSKGTFVAQVSALDEDKGGRLLYHIIDGNHDNAFVMEPPLSGIVKTNIVLDREIRDSYLLTIIATDTGEPQLTGTCTLRVSVVDVNDNQPVFPPDTVVSVSEGAEVGSVLTTITANDVDTHPTLTYTFADGDSNPESLFAVDRFSGRITLAGGTLDHERRHSYQLRLRVSDTAHVAETLVTVHVTDINDNAPRFTQQSYHALLAESVSLGTSVIAVSATDMDSGNNAAVRYALVDGARTGFYIHESTGVIYTNRSLVFDPKHPIIQLLVRATDRGEQALSSLVAVRIQVADVNNNAPKFLEGVYRSWVLEDASPGSTILRVSATDMDVSRDNHNINYCIVDGNEGNTFVISGSTGEIVLVRSLDRELLAQYTLRVAAMDRGTPSMNATAQVVVVIQDVNDHAPVFNQTLYEASVSEMATVGTRVIQVAATDKDEGQHARVTYDITSGNDEKVFAVDSQTGLVTVTGSLDYDTIQEYKLVVRATDGDQRRPLSALVSIIIRVRDENDNNPLFPLAMYTEFVEESSPVGTVVFTARAMDADRGQYGRLNYTLAEGEGRDKFRIDPSSGVVTTEAVFDYESKNRYYFTVLATDAGGKYATVQVQVDIESRDEYPPSFRQKAYRFSIPGDASLGYTVGQVHATDLDQGPDGKVLYHLRGNNPYFKMNATTGVITLRTAPSRQDTNLEVVAGTGRPGSLTATVVVQVGLDFSLNASRVAEEQPVGTLPAWGVGLVVVLAIVAAVLLTLIVLLRLRHKRGGKPAVDGGFDSTFDTVDIRHTTAQPPGGSGMPQFPPHYNEISHYDTPDDTPHLNGGGTTSEASEQSHSASSGRGSAEDGDDVEDEEIRMINEGLQKRLDEDDNVSDVSIHNTQEYLARLGISTGDESWTSHKTSTENVYDVEDDEAGDDVSSLIYTKLNDVGSTQDSVTEQTFGFDGAEPSMTGSLSSIVHSEEELTGSYNWDYLLDWGPQYQPLAHVFAEIARLKDDTGTTGSTRTVQGRKFPPPPLITNAVAPCSVAPVALNTGLASQPVLLPRSPIGVEGYASAMCPSFSPSLSPLATKSPSVSPLVPLYATNSVQSSIAAARSSQRSSIHNSSPCSGNELRI
ncbi:protein dachsous-like [Ornithodoros turicata]|uniref:protein dachsous-like n=1 Tax=Ornithodoros turicata TaxID=34597 RepID=UPI0031387238